MRWYKTASTELIFILGVEMPSVSSIDEGGSDGRKVGETGVSMISFWYLQYEMML